MVQLKKGDILYHARILPSLQVYEVCELKVRTVSDTWFVGVNKRDKHAFLFNYKDIDKTVFFERNSALLKVIDEEERNSDNDEKLKKMM